MKTPSEIKPTPGVSCQNKRGEWVPAIPESYPIIPSIIDKNRCHCGMVFWSEEAYRGHYALKHILAL